MPRTPTSPSPFNSKQVAPSILGGEKFDASAPLAAFGEGPEVERVFQSAENVENIGLSIEEKAKRDQDALRVQQHKIHFLGQKNQWMSTALSQKGENAFAAVPQVNEAFDKTAKDMSEDLQNDSQRAEFKSFLAEEKVSTMGTLSNHVTQQRKELDLNSTSALIQNYINDGANNWQDANHVARAEGMLRKTLDEYHDRQGMPVGDPARIADTRDQLSVFHGSVVAQMLAGNNPDSAKSYFEKHKEEIVQSRQPQLEKEINTAKNQHIAIQMLKEVGHYTYPDGSPNLSKMQDAVLARTDLNDEQKQQVIRDLAPLASSRYKAVTQQKMEAERGFQNAMATNLKQGVDLNTALSQVPKFGGDEATQLHRETYLKRLYAKDDTNPDTKAPALIFDDIIHGRATPQAIDEALKNKEINTKEYETLSRKYKEAIVSGVTPEEKVAWPQIQELAKRKFGKDDPAKENFLRLMITKSNGLMSTDIVKVAKEELGKDPNTGGFLGFGKKRQFESDLTKQDATSPVWNRINQDLGHPVTKAIIDGLNAHGGPPVTPKDISDFADRFGGADSLKTGGRANKAILFLIANYPKSPVTAKNVEWALGKTGGQ